MGGMPTQPPRRRGRRPKSGTAKTPAVLSRAEILSHAASLVKDEPFSEISMARLARDLEVAPSLIHYHFGSRDSLLSLLLNTALAEVLDSAPTLVGQWRTDLENLLGEFHAMQMRWKGLTAHVAASNQYRLFQPELLDGKDFGLLYFNRVGLIFRDGGFTPKQSATAYHVIMLFLLSVARAEVFDQEPVEKRESIVDHVGKFSATELPGSAFMLEPFVALDASVSFDVGLSLLLDGIEGWLRPYGE